MRRSKREGEGGLAVLGRAWCAAEKACPNGRCKQARSVRGDQHMRMEGFSLGQQCPVEDPESWGA